MSNKFANVHVAYQTFCRKNQYPNLHSLTELQHYWVSVIGIEKLYGFNLKSSGLTTMYAKAENYNQKYVCFSWQDGFWTITADGYCSEIYHTDLLRNIDMIKNIAELLDLPARNHASEINKKIFIHDARIRDYNWSYDHYRFFCC